MNWTMNRVDSNDKNRKLDWFKLKKIVIGTIQGDQFLCISHKFNYKFDSRLLQCFSLDFLIPFYHCLLLLLYSLPLSSLPPMFKPNCWCLILVPSVPSRSLYVIVVKLKTTIQVSHPHKCGQRVSCRAFNAMVAVFSLDILGLSFVLCFCNAYPCQQNFLEHSPGRQTTSTDLNIGWLRRHSSSAQPPGPLWSKLTSSFTNMGSLNNAYPSSDDP